MLDQHGRQLCGINMAVSTSYVESIWPQAMWNQHGRQHKARDKNKDTVSFFIIYTIRFPNGTCLSDYSSKAFTSNSKYLDMLLELSSLMYLLLLHMCAAFDSEWILFGARMNTTNYCE